MPEPVQGVSVGPGGYHTLTVTVTGRIFSWGHNRVGQLGCDPTECELRLNEMEVRLDGERRDELETLELRTKAAQAHTSVQDAPPL